MIDNKRVIAVVIGRAGSKGLPGKNAKRIAGQPMICHTIDDAGNAIEIDRAIVSTDGHAIAAAAHAMGVETISRPPALADDTTSVDGVLVHAAEKICNDNDFEPDILVVLYANVPVRPAGLIDTAVRTLHKTGADSVQSYCEVGKYHPYWMVRLDDGGSVSQFFANQAFRRQDLPQLFIPDGGVIAVTRSSVLAADPFVPGSFLGSDRRGIHTRPGEVVDVDTQADFLRAEEILRKRQHMETPA